MKVYYCIIFFLLIFCSYGKDNNTLKITGETDYIQKTNKTLITSLNLEYKIDIYTHPNNIYLIYVGGKISNDYDHFGNELKNNVFTTIGIDF